MRPPAPPPLQTGSRPLITSWLAAVLVAIVRPALAAPILPVPEAVPCAVTDRQDAQMPGAGHWDGFLGARLDANVSGRLLTVDESRLLEGFRQRPGRQAWDGEHVGKWLHAATLAWAYTGDPRLREKLDRVVGELGKCQLEDGYLGTYLPEQRWTEWDVWAHKYDMIGLLTYYRFTGNPQALEISRRCADLLCRTFGKGPGQRNLLDAGWHMGMAPTSVLEPMVLLYRVTGDEKYLGFCRYILSIWETPKGPRIVSTLLTAKRVDKVGNAKAYEMLSCLNGLLEFHRTTGDEKALQAALNAWQDIVEKRLYLTGTASYKELFHDDYDLPNGNADVGETCVTVTWIQFNAQLLRLTGEARFAEALERSVYNQLFGAQKPDGTAWGYYVQLEGTKPYSSKLSGHCCLSSGPRGVALVPTFTATTDAEDVVINFLAGGRSSLTLRDGRKIEVESRSNYPAEGRALFVLHPSPPGAFHVKIRIPAWCPNATIQINGRPVETPVRPGEYAVLRREWRDADRITLDVPLKPRLLAGDHTNRGKIAFAYGPLILAADDALNPGAPIGSFRIGSTNLEKLAFETQPMPEDRRTSNADQIFSINAILSMNVLDRKAGDSARLRLVSFANAGSTLAPYQVWLPGPPTPDEKPAAGTP
jgi:uncharacterized protein